jgi:hypothetical protein
LASGVDSATAKQQCAATDTDTGRCLLAASPYAAGVPALLCVAFSFPPHALAVGSGGGGFRPHDESGSGRTYGHRPHPICVCSPLPSADISSCFVTKRVRGWTGFRHSIASLTFRT